MRSNFMNAVPRLYAVLQISSHKQTTNGYDIHVQITAPRLVCPIVQKCSHLCKMVHTGVHAPED
jgi:hypothetical protein